MFFYFLAYLRYFYIIFHTVILTKWTIYDNVVCFRSGRCDAAPRASQRSDKEQPATGNFPKKGATISLPEGDIPVCPLRPRGEKMCYGFFPTLRPLGDGLKYRSQQFVSHRRQAAPTAYGGRRRRSRYAYLDAGGSWTRRTGMDNRTKTRLWGRRASVPSPSQIFSLLVKVI
jgi:hypothetical protein